MLQARYIMLLMNADKLLLKAWSHRGTDDCSSLITEKDHLNGTDM